MSRPIYSVCIPTYNRAERLAASIGSAITALADRPAEILIIDNASDDRTADVVARFDSSLVQYHRFEKLVSMYDNHNRCIDVAAGDWIAILHSDDTYPPHYFDDIEFVLRSEPQADLITDLLIGDTGLHIDDIEVDPNLGRAGASVAAAIMVGGGGPPSGSMYRRDAFDQSPNFDGTNLAGDQMLAIDWALDNRRVVHHKPDPPVWTLKDCSLSLDPEMIRLGRRQIQAVIQRGLRSPRRDEVQSQIRRLWPRINRATRTRLIYRLAASGHRRFAFSLLATPQAAACLTHRRFYIQSLPSVLMPEFYHWLRMQYLKRPASTGGSKTQHQVHHHGR